MNHEREPAPDAFASHIRPAVPPALPGASASGSQPPTIGRFRVIGRLGTGGFGSVYRCFDPSLHREVAVKVMNPGTFAGEEELRRFTLEARTAASLRHRAVIGVYETGAVAEMPFIVMELVEGETLESLVRRGGIDRRHAVAAVQATAGGLDEAHAHGIVHRDVKPANIIMDRDGNARIGDFGLARDLGNAHRLTETGTTLGTPSYMAPEQVDGQRDQGPWTDVYGLGATLYFALTGRPPFRGATSYATLAEVLNDPPVPPTELEPSIPRGLEAVVLRCLAKKPEDRFPSAAAVARALERGGVAAPARSHDRTPAGTRPGGGGTVAIASVGAALGAGLLVAGILLLTADTGPRSGDDASSSSSGASGHPPTSATSDPSSPPFDADAAYDEAVRLGKSGDQEASETALRRLLDRAPEHARARCHLAKILEWTGRIEEALAEATRAVDLDADLAEPWLNRAEIRARAGRLDLAIEDCDTAIERFPESVEAWSLRGSVVSETDPARALADHDRAVQLGPDDVRARVARGVSRKRTGDLAGAIRDYDRAIELDPTHFAAWVNRANAHKIANDLPAALRDLDRAVVVDGRQVQGWQDRAEIRRMLGDHAGALEDFDHAIGIAPAIGALRTRRAYTVWEMRDASRIRQARTDADKGVELDPMSAMAWRVRAQIRRAMGDNDGAIVDYRRSLEIEPATWVRLNIANALRDRGDLEEALREYDEAIAEGPPDPMALANRAVARARSGDLGGALDDVDRALAIDPRSTYALDQRVRIRAQAGDLDGAIQDAERYLDIAGGGGGAAAMNALLQQLRAEKQRRPR